MLKEQKLLTSTLSKICKNTDGCEDQYRCYSALYLMSVLYQCHLIIIDRGIRAHGHGKEVVDGINTIDKQYIYQLIYNVQLPGSKTFDLYILMHSCTKNNYVILNREFQIYPSKEHRKYGVIDQVKYSKISGKRK